MSLDRYLLAVAIDERAVSARRGLEIRLTLRPRTWLPRLADNKGTNQRKKFPMSVADRAPVSLFIMSFAQQYFTAVARCAQDRDVFAKTNGIIEGMVVDAVAAVEAVPFDDEVGAEKAVAAVVMSAIQALASTTGFGDADLLYWVATQHLQHRPAAPSA
jgi:hypothetical protein